MFNRKTYSLKVLFFFFLLLPEDDGIGKTFLKSRVSVSLLSHVCCDSCQLKLF